MRIFNKIFGRIEEWRHYAALSQVFNPLMDKINIIDDREVKNFFKIILDAARRSLHGILFMAPEEFHFEKRMTKKEIGFWLSKTSLAFISYSYYFYDDTPGIRKNQDLANLGDASYKSYWQRMFDYYNQIFNENIGQREIDHYASGLKEDMEKGYSKSGDMKKTIALAKRDYKTISSELLQKVWEKDIDSNERKGLLLGLRIWQAHQQIVQPFLVKLIRG